LRRLHGLTVWQDGKIPAGDEFDPAIKEQLTTADIIVLLVSAQFFASDYCYCIEMEKAVARHDRGDAIVIPVIVDHVARWHDAPFGKLKAMPHDGRPVINWRPQSEAWAQVAEAIHARLTANTPQPESPPSVRKPVAVHLPWPENPYFQDPHGILERIAAALDKGGATAVTHGMGGVGKTQAALHYAQRNKDKYRLVWWVEAETEAGLDLAYAAIAKALRLPEAAARDMAETRAAVRDWLGREAGWLLVFDNAEEARSLEQHLPRCPAGHVIVTSRSSAWDRIATPLPLERWPVAESANFLLARTGRSDRAEAEALARDLDGLPLALEQAAAYVKETGIGFAAYRRLFEERFAALAGREPPRDYPAPLLTTWDVSLHAAERACPAAGDLMRLLAVFAPDDIPRSLFREHANELPAPLDALADPLMFNEAVAALQRYSLVKATDEALSVHRLVQRVTTSRCDNSDRWINASVRLTSAAFPQHSNDVRTWPQCARLRPHAEALLVHLKDTAAETQPAARLLNQLGIYLQYRAELSPARACFERALRIDEAAYGPDHPKVAIDTNNIGGVLREQGDLNGARACYERALRIDEAAYGPDHPEVAIDTNNLGRVLRDQGDLDSARAHLERALRIDEAAYGPNHPDVAIRVNNLGAVLRGQGDLDGARACYERALRIDEAGYGPDHPVVANRANNLGRVLADQGNLDGARACTERALRILQKFLGDDHPNTKIVRGNLEFLKILLSSKAPC
jgi:tetratricopeptide (TPR) repeat protein